MGLTRWSGRVAARARLLLLLLAFGVLLASLARTVYGATDPLRSHAEARPAREFAHTDLNPFGANFFLGREVEPWKRERTLRLAADAGIGWAKLHFPWEEIEPLRKGDYTDPVRRGSSWAKFDEIVDLCEVYGLRIVARLDRPPAWTREDNSLQQSPPDDLEDYGDFVYEFAKRYRGRIDYIQVWNEPNIYPEWGNRPVDPAQYVALLEVAYRRAKEANPNVYVLSAPLAMTLGEPHPEAGRWRSMSDLQYLEAMYQAGAAAYFDIHSANAFGFDRPPDDPPDPSVLNLQRVLLQREIMVRYGDGHKSVWFNEYGWNAAPAAFEDERLVWGRVSESDQAAYTVRGIQMARQEWPWAGVFMIWYFRQVGNIPDDRADYYFRMVDTDFTVRPLYLAVREAARFEVPGPGLYAHTHRAARPQGHWENVVSPGSAGDAVLRSDRPGDSITFTFRGPQLDLLTRTGPEGGRLLVVLDGHTVPGLKTDGLGRSYVDLYSPMPPAWGRVPLVARTSGGQHTVTITVADTAHPASAGRECVVDAFEVLLAEDAPFPVWQTGGLSLGLAANGWLVWRAWRRSRWAIMGR